MSGVNYRLQLMLEYQMKLSRIDIQVSTNTQKKNENRIAVDQESKFWIHITLPIPIDKQTMTKPKYYHANREEYVDPLRSTRCSLWFNNGTEYSDHNKNCSNTNSANIKNFVPYSGLAE